MPATATKLTRAEEAYAHLASFQLGDLVDIEGPRFYMPGNVTGTQQDGETLEDASVAVTGTPGTNGARQAVRVSDLLDGWTISLRADVIAGNVRYFDAAGYAWRNSEA